jgi:hypothetical protein
MRILILDCGIGNLHYLLQSPALFTERKTKLRLIKMKISH